MANLPLGFGELAIGGILVAVGFSDTHSFRDVLAGTATFGGGSGPATAAASAPAGASATGQATPGTGPVGTLRKPLTTMGKIIGVPYQGTHTLFGNWQSDNAIDIATPVGTPVYAVAAGTIGNNIGPLDASNPLLAGLRLTVNTVAGNAVYYAHLSQLAVTAGQQVKAGQLLGYSGSANGVAHLHIALENGNPLSVFG